MVEQIRDVNITKIGQMLNFNISSYDSFLTETTEHPDSLRSQYGLYLVLYNVFMLN